MTRLDELIAESRRLSAELALAECDAEKRALSVRVLAHISEMMVESRKLLDGARDDLAEINRRLAH